jgi:hypothetical protein
MYRPEDWMILQESFHNTKKSYQFQLEEEGHKGSEKEIGDLSISASSYEDVKL